MVFVLDLEKGNVDEGGVEVDELKQKREQFYRQRRCYCHQYIQYISSIGMFATYLQAKVRKVDFMNCHHCP